MQQEQKFAELAPPREPSLLDEIVEASGPAPDVETRLAGPAPHQVVVGECVNARHPSLAGRILARWTRVDAGASWARWVPVLHGVVVREGDRVLLTQPANWPEPIVTGVVDGYAKRPVAERATGATLELERDEALRVIGIHGEPLVEVFQTDEGPVVRLLQANVDLELPGALRVSAQSIRLQAREGELQLEAHDDVVVKGETINLN